MEFVSSVIVPCNCRIL